MAEAERISKNILREFFSGLVEKHYRDNAGLRDSEISARR